MAHSPSKSVFELAYCEPPALSVSEAVMRAHEEQVRRMQRTQKGVEMRGKLRWNVKTLGWDFEPGEGADSAIMDLISSGKIGGEVTVTLTL